VKRVNHLGSQKGPSFGYGMIEKSKLAQYANDDGYRKIWNKPTFYKLNRIRRIYKESARWLVSRTALQSEFHLSVKFGLIW
jgi:hypothetical protein